MKNKGIIISGGEINATNLAVGDESKIEYNADESGKKKFSPESKKLVNEIKGLIAQGEVKEVIQMLLSHFENKENNNALNDAIMQSAALIQLEMQENRNVISHEQAKIDKAKITNAILHLIDNEIKK